MFKLMDKKINEILRLNVLLNWRYGTDQTVQMCTLISATVVLRNFRDMANNEIPY